MDAVYNICSDDIRISSTASEKLPAEQWEHMKRTYNFRWFPGQKLMVAKWSPQAEDYVTDVLGCTIEEENKPDDPESRVNRYLGYSSNAARRSEQQREYADGVSERFAGGQPILCGHHSERGARRDAKRIENAMRASIAESEKAAYWQSRADGAIRRAMQKENPAVIYRRIHGPDGIEKHIRGHNKNISTNQVYLNQWIAVGEDVSKETAMGIANYDQSYWDPKDHETLWGALDADKCTPSQARERAIEAHTKSIEWHQRWLDHLQMLLDYNQALYVASGGIATDEVKPEVGGAIRCWVRSGWVEIVKVNKVSVTVWDNWGNGGNDFKRMVKMSDIKAILSKAEFDLHKADGTLPERYQQKERAE
jgi:hypothetical protein